MQEGKEELEKFRELRKISAKSLHTYQPGAVIATDRRFERSSEPTGDPVSPAMLLYNMGSWLLGGSYKSNNELHNKPKGSYSGMVPEHLRKK